MSTASRRHVASLLKSIVQSRSAAPKFPLSTRSSLTSSYTTPISSRMSTQIRTLHHTSRLFQDGGVQAPVDQITSFKELGTKNLIDDSVLRSIVEDMKIENMTPVQVQTINPCLAGSDVIAQAKTGTGKTLGFLVPIIQRILKEKPDLSKYRGHSRGQPDIRAIIVSPTRELAEQIAVEAKKITRHTALKVQTAVGGTQKSRHLAAIQREGCHILVGTPGRLQDVLSDPSTGVSAENLDAFVLDEADRLLDQGFAPDILKIHDQCLPRKDVKDRQTLMFSATMPREVIDIVRKLMKRDFKFVKTVSDDEVPTHEKVPQKQVDCVGMQNMLPTLVEFTKRELEAGRTNGKPFKAIVFHNSNAEVQLYHEIFEKLTGTGRSRFRGPMGGSEPVLKGLRCTQMNARLSQNARTRNSDFFRHAESAILFSSDVSARGMDFPKVTHVIQLGIPQNPESYVHRIGRTGRGDKTGEAWLLTTPIDARESKYRLRGMPLEKDDSLQCATVDMAQDGQIPASIASILTASVEAARSSEEQSREAAYGSMLGVYGWADSRTLVEQINNQSRYCWGMQTPPPVNPSLAQKLGIARIPGLNLVRKPRTEDDGSQPSRGNFGGDRDGRSGNFGGDRGARSGNFGGDRGARSGNFGGDRGARSGGFSDRGGRGGGRGFQSRGGDRGGDRFDRRPSRSFRRDDDNEGFGGQRRERRERY